MRNFLVLGAGYTGLRVAKLLQRKNEQVAWTNRHSVGSHRFDAEVDDPSQLLKLIDGETVILHSIPTLRTQSGLQEITPELVQALRISPPARIVYVSTTGVYGENRLVDETTLPAPRTEREHLRTIAEAAILCGPWSSMILRPAAIYGPNRGIHASLRAGTFHLPENPSNYVSRIHVDDLAAHCHAAMLSPLEGAFPVADEEPCTSLEAAQFCAKLLGISMPPSAPAEALGETRRADRRVDGSAIRELLSLRLLYPSYKTGFPACLASEDFARSIS